MTNNNRLKIKNFGPIKEIDIELKEINIFIGPQASGKSTIAKLIHFFEYIISDFPFSNTDSKSLLSIFNKLFGELYLLNSPNTEIEYIYNNGEKITIKNNKLKFNNLPKRDHKTILIPAGRAVYSLISDSLFSLSSEAVNIDPIILNFGRQIELSRKRLGFNTELETMFENILNGKFKYINGENRIYFNTDKYITLDRASSGQQEVLPLILILRDVLSSQELTEITLEEPEAHLYPYSQYKLIELISWIYNSHHKKNRFIITTHSPYILSSFNNLLFAYKVANLTETSKLKVKQLIPETCWIAPDKIAAYSVNEGTTDSIVNPSTGLIADNEIDDASEDIAGYFDQLLEIYRQFKHG
jgi:predicted ATPase